MNKRRKLIIAIGSSALVVAPLGALAQQSKIWRVGLLSPRSRPASLDSDVFGAFLQGMRDFGYVEGKNLLVESRFADEKHELLPGLAAELVQLKVDVIVAGSSQAISAAQKATTTIPIIMGSTGDPVGSGFVKSLAHPGGNITGLTTMSTDVSGKRIELLHGMVPKLSRVGVLVDPTSSSYRTQLTNIQLAARSLGLGVSPMEARSEQEIRNAFTTMNREKVGAVVVTVVALYIQRARQIAELAAQHRLSSIAGFREYAKAGGLMSYGASFDDMYRRAATYVVKIFKGANPGELPVEQPTKFELIINGKTAKALGLTIPQSLLIGVDRVIE